MGRRRRSGSGAAEREALRRAGQQTALVGEVVRFGLVTGLLLLFLPPVGVAVGFFWGIGLARRVWGHALEPRLRDRLAERELARTLPGAPPRPVLAPVRVADLVDGALAPRAERIAERGELRREGDASAAIAADAELLGRALGDLLDDALAALAPSRAARLALEWGENLAGDEVWIRLRGAPVASDREPAGRGLEEARRIVTAHGGALEVGGLEPGTVAYLVTLPGTMAP